MNTINYTIRPLAPLDFHTVAGWLSQLPLWRRYNIQPDSVVRRFGAAHLKGDILLTADADGAGGKQIGCGVAWVEPQGAFGRSPYLRILGASSPGGGVGALLLNAAEQAACAYGDQMFLLCSDFNTDAQRFYVRHGYAQIGVIPGFVVPDVAECIFHKRLAPAPPR